MRALTATAMMMLVAGPVYAQEAHVHAYGEPDPAKSKRQIETEQANQNAYEKSLSNVRDKPAADPWGIARSADAPKDTKDATKPAAKARQAKPATKTGSTAN